jgi:hypothetical protein
VLTSSKWAIKVKQVALSKWGTDKGFNESWTLSQLDRLSYDQLLADILPHFPLNTTDQLNSLILIGGSKIRNDQSALYEYLFPQNLPYKKWHSQLIKTVLSEEAFSSLCLYIEKVKTKKPVLSWCDVFMRYSLHDPLYLRDLHQQLTPLVENVLKRKLTPTYSYLSMYGENGICPPHLDKPECQWTLDLCVKQDKPWPLSVENDSFLMKENEALIYSGTDQLHWREKIHSGGFCDLVFFHFKEN